MKYQDVSLFQNSVTFLRIYFENQPLLLNNSRVAKHILRRFYTYKYKRNVRIHH